jgi:hypothetical protein
MTFVSYPNITATSENGDYRIEITGMPDNNFFREQKDFVYRLFHSDNVVWEWKPLPAKNAPEFLDDYPHEAWVSDDGWVVVRTHEWFHAGLLVMSPEGRVVLRRQFRSFGEGEEPGFLDGEPEEYLGESSAGPFWAESAFAYFTKNNGTPFWVIRTWWGRRVVIDLKNLVLSNSPPDLDTALKLESAWVQKSLLASVKKLEEVGRQLEESEDRKDFWSLASTVMTGAYHAGWLDARDAIPFLRRLENIDLAGSTGLGPISWASLIYLPFRQVAKLSLLRLKEEPTWLSSYRFRKSVTSARNAPEYADEFFEFPAKAVDRSPSLLRQGLTQKEILLCIGAPDVIERDQWEYDFVDHESCFTVRVHWDSSHLEGLHYDVFKEAAVNNPPRIAHTEVLEPQWKKITRRDRDVIV